MPFAMIPPSLIRDTRLSRSDLRVFVGLSTFADRDNRTCWPSRKALGLVCGISSLSLVSAALQRLQRYGWIEVEHRYGSSVYQLLDGLERQLDPVHPVVVTPVHPVVVDMNRPSEHINTPPLPPASAAAAVERELEIIEASATAPESRSELPTVEDRVSGTVEDQNAVAVILAYVATTAGVRPTARRHQTAIEQALAAGFTVEQCKIALAYCASHWSNAAWALPSAVLKLDRLPEVLAQAKAGTGTGTGGGGGGGAAYRLFEREPEPERASPGCVASHLSRLKAALAAA